MSDLEGMISSVLSNPDEMKKIMEMASSLMGNVDNIQESEAPPPPPKTSAPSGGQGMPDFGDLLKGASNLPPELAGAAMKLMKGFGKKDSGKHALVTAMKPYLSEKRRNKLDKAVQLARVFGVGLELFGANGGLFK